MYEARPGRGLAVGDGNLYKIELKMIRASWKMVLVSAAITSTTGVFYPKLIPKAFT